MVDFYGKLVGKYAIHGSYWYYLQKHQMYTLLIPPVCLALAGGKKGVYQGCFSNQLFDEWAMLQNEIAVTCCDTYHEWIVIAYEIIRPKKKT